MADAPPRAPFLPQLRELTRHRILGLLRQPEALFWTFGFSILMAIALGLAFSRSEPATSVVGVLAGDSTEPAWLGRLAGNEYVRVERFAAEPAAEAALRVGKVDLLVRAEETPRLRFDPTRAEAELARLRVEAAHRGDTGAPLASDHVRERGARYIDFLLPGLIGMNLMGTGLWSIGFAIADIRQKKLLRRLMATPMRRSAFLGSFLVARIVFLVTEVVLLAGFAVWIMGVPMRGGIGTFAGVCILGACAFAGLGLLVASRVRTIEGVSGILNLVMMPMWLGSGVFFSYERFPDVVHGLLRALPLTAANDALRATMLEGASPSAILPELVVLALWACVPFTVALRIFRWD